MNKLQEIKKWLNQVGQSRPATIILSVFFAILIWFTVSVIVYPTTPVTFYHIPVVVELKGTSAEKSGLSMVSCDVETVDVQLVGDRSEVGILTEKDLVAYAVIQDVTTSGEYKLSLTVKSDQNVDFEVNEISPATASVTFDKIETREFEVTPSFPNIKITAGHTMDTVTCDPPTIEIKGPSAQLDKIKSVVVSSDKQEEIDSSYSLYSDEMILYTADGSMLDPDGLEIPDVDFLINIPLLTQKTLDLSYEIRNVPSKFDIAWLRDRLKLSAETITLASPNNAALENQETFNIGNIGEFIKLEDIGLTFSKTFDVSVSEGIINKSGLQDVTLTLDAEGLEKRDFVVGNDNITIVNAPSTFDFEVITQNMTITVIGPAEELEKLSAKDIAVTVDLFNYNAGQASSFSEAPLISFMGSDKLWAYGAYNVAIDCTEKEPNEE